MEKYSRNLSILTSDKKVRITGKWRYFLPFSNKACKAHLMLVTGFKSVIVLDEQCLKVWAETPEIAKIFWTVFYGKWPKTLAFFLLLQVLRI